MRGNRTRKRIVKQKKMKNVSHEGVQEVEKIMPQVVLPAGRKLYLKEEEEEVHLRELMEVKIVREVDGK